MFYALIGSLLAGGLSTAILLFLRSRVETKLVEAQKDLLAERKAHEITDSEFTQIKTEYNKLVEHANDQIKTLEKERDDLLNALSKVNAPGVFADLLRKRNTGHQDPH